MTYLHVIVDRRTTRSSKHLMERSVKFSRWTTWTLRKNTHELFYGYCVSMCHAKELGIPLDQQDHLLQEHLHHRVDPRGLQDPTRQRRPFTRKSKPRHRLISLGYLPEVLRIQQVPSLLEGQLHPFHPRVPIAHNKMVSAFPSNWMRVTDFQQPNFTCGPCKPTEPGLP